MSNLISALNANGMLHANASSNVANLNTEDYKSIKTTLTSGANGEIETVTVRDDTPGVPTEDGKSSSNVDLSKEFSDMILAQRGFEAALTAISTREEMLNDLMRVFKNND